jgi:DNA-directed RNA polymerase specialized sigma24 family protein
MVGAAVERYAELHVRGELPVQPSKLAVIARNAGIDELRRLEKRHGSAGWALPLNNRLTPDGDSFIDMLADPDAHEFPDDLAQRLLVECRAGLIMGAELTAGERRVVRLLSKGLRQMEIARRLGVTEGRVCQIVGQLKTRLAPDDRGQST